MPHRLSARLSRAAVYGMLAFATPLAVPAAHAQVIDLSVNGDPITSIDIEQRMRLLRAIHRPATRQAAIESMIETRLKAREASKFGVSIADNEIGQQVQDDAAKLKTSPTALVNAISGAGVDQDHLRTYFKAELGFSLLIKALNRGVEASEIAVRDEMAKERVKGGITNFSLRQIVFTVSPNASPAELQASAKQAEALRARFSSCDSGIPYAKSLPNVAVRSPLTRSSTSLPDGIKEVLEKTPVGHVTQPSRSPNGIEVIAVCSKSSAGTDDELRKTVSDRILSRHLAEAEQAKYRELRSRAVISKTQ